MGNRGFHEYYDDAEATNIVERVFGSIAEAKNVFPSLAALQTARQQAAEAKKDLETYCYTVRNWLCPETQEQETQLGKDKLTIERAVWQTLDWLYTNESAKKDEYTAKQKELEGLVNLINVDVSAEKDEFTAKLKELEGVA